MATKKSTRQATGTTARKTAKKAIAKVLDAYADGGAPKAKKPAPKKATAKRMGRPPRAAEGLSVRSVLVRLTEAEHASLEAAAERGGKALAAFVRDAALKIAKSS